MSKTPNPIDCHVGARVRMRRMMIEMSQEKLGNQLGLTFQQVQKYEKGTNRIGASRLLHIATILQAPISFFFEGAPTIAGTRAPLQIAPSPSFLTDFLASADGLSFATAFRTIPDPALRRQLVKTIEAVALSFNSNKQSRKRAA
jgi:transcriptional regulator with XRE-family HTH domain